MKKLTATQQARCAMLDLDNAIQTTRESCDNISRNQQILARAADALERCIIEIKELKSKSNPKRK